MIISTMMIILTMVTISTMMTVCKEGCIVGGYLISYNLQPACVRKLEVIWLDARALPRRLLWMMNGEWVNNSVPYVGVKLLGQLKNDALHFWLPWNQKTWFCYFFSLMTKLWCQHQTILRKVLSSSSSPKSFPFNYVSLSPHPNNGVDEIILMKKWSSWSNRIEIVMMRLT